MDPDHELPHGLSRLADAVEDPSTDLAGELRRLGETLGDAVPSYVGASFVLHHDDTRVVLDVWRDGSEPRTAQTSLWIPLQLLCGASPDSALVIYASRPGALVDLAADVSYALGAALTRFPLDRHLDRPHAARAGEQGPSGLVAFSLVNQAVGVFMAHGMDGNEARDELRRLSDEADLDLEAAAAQVVNRLGPGPGPQLVPPA